MSINLARNTVYLTQEEYDTLVTTGTVTLASGTTINYSEDDTYIIPEQYDSTPELNSTNPVTSDGIKKELNKGITGLSVSGRTITYTKADGTTGTITTQDTNTTYSNFVKSGTGAAAGLVPSPGTTAGTTRFLREDGTWVVPTDTNTTYNNMSGATASTAGTSGLVPAPAAGSNTKYLRGDGTWQVPTNTTYSNFVKSGTGAAAGLVPSPGTTAGTTKFLCEDGTWKAPNFATTNDVSNAISEAITNVLGGNY